MKRLLLGLWLVLLMPGLVFAQVDTKMSDLTELATTPADSDEFYVNDGGTSKKIQYSTLLGTNLLAYQDIAPSANAQTLLGQTFAQMQGSLSIDDIITLTGMAEGSVNLGTFTGTTINDNITIKAALQALETAVEGPGSANIEDDIYGAGWNGDTANGASQNALYDYLIQLDTDADGDIDSLDAALSTSWQTTSGVTHLQTSTDSVIVGSSSNIGKLGVVGDTDEVQIVARGNATQTNNLYEGQQSDGTKVFQVTNNGDITIGDGSAGVSISQKESSSAPTGAAGYGTFYTLDTDPTTPGFVDDDNVAHTLQYGINWSTIDELVLDGINWADHEGIESINWTSIDEVVLDGINWTYYANANGVNWTTVDETKLDGINWDYYAAGGEGVNWDDITELDLTGINWTYYGEAGGINWTTIDELVLDGINWADYLNIDINWTEVTELVLDGINWSEYENVAINWSEVTELVLDGINWSDYENEDINWTTITEATLDGINWESYGDAGINWADITETDLTGINWTDYDITHPAEMADADFGDFTCSSGDCTLDSASSANFVMYLRPQQAKLPASSAAAINPAGNALWTILFDDDDAECVYWPGTWLRPFSGTLKTKLAYKMASATSGTTEYELSIACVSDTDNDDDAPTFGPADSLTATVPGTAGLLDVLADASLNGDSCAVDDIIYVKLCSDADDEINDTATGDDEFVGGVIYAE
jgi:hypothetical protein